MAGPCFHLADSQKGQRVKESKLKEKAKSVEQEWRKKNRNRMKMFSTRWKVRRHGQNRCSHTIVFVSTARHGRCRQNRQSSEHSVNCMCHTSLPRMTSWYAPNACFEKVELRRCAKHLPLQLDAQSHREQRQLAVYFFILCVLYS